MTLNLYQMPDKIKDIVERAIPLTMDCEIKRSAELKRRAALRIEIEQLLRDNSVPFAPTLEFKNGETGNKIRMGEPAD